MDDFALVAGTRRQRLPCILDFVLPRNVSDLVDDLDVFRPCCLLCITCVTQRAGHSSSRSLLAAFPLEAALNGDIGDAGCDQETLSTG